MGEVHNPSTEYLYNAAIKQSCYLSSTGAIMAYSGDITGRVPEYKRIVCNNRIENIWWNDKIHKKITLSAFSYLKKETMNYFIGKQVYVIDCYAGWDLENRIKVRLICCEPYHALFAKNMFIPIDKNDMRNPDVIIHNAGMHKIPENEYYEHDKVVAMDLYNKEILIMGTRYAGEIKKSILTYMMFEMVNRGHLPLHSSANIGTYGDISLFFGLSGTGKTTLSTEKNRRLIGDDEHVWSDNGVFNIEGGCYAKCINLSKEKEPEIFNAIKYGALLENVIFDDNYVVDYNNTSITKNTRCSYPLSHIDNSIIPAVVNKHPKNIILLTCDANFTFPPVAKLNVEQAVFFFICGYTTKIPGTELGVDKPIDVFSACYGEPFLVYNPKVYGELLRKKLLEHSPDIWLVNTGWIGKERISIKYTREIINRIHDMSLASVPMTRMKHFDILVPIECGDIPKEIICPIHIMDPLDSSEKIKNLYDKFVEVYNEKTN